jgi:hypothetical protein
MQGDCINGSGAVALPCEKIYVGKFKNSRIEGIGEFHFPTSATIKPKTVCIKGEWSSTVKGNLTIANDDSSFPFSVDKAMINGKKNSRYIQYPNYDEYIG